MGFFEKLKNGLGKTKSSINEKINNVFSVFRKVDEELLEELEEVLIMSDIGMETSVRIIEKLRERIKKEKIEDEEDVKKALREIMQELVDVAEPEKKRKIIGEEFVRVFEEESGKIEGISFLAQRARKIISNGKESSGRSCRLYVKSKNQRRMGKILPVH